jgi:ribonuclease D
MSMDNNTARPYRYIETEADFRSYREHLADRKITTLALDLEAEFNLHVYGEHFCLLQLYDGHQAVLVDPQFVPIELLQAFLEDRDILKITYDSASDRSLLFRNHGIRMRSILDLRPAVELLQLEKQGLSSVLEIILGLEPEVGKKRYQQYNWMRRPIDPGAISYALGDVYHLFELKEQLMKRLNDRSLMDRFILANQKVQDQDPQVNRKPGFLRSNRFERLGEPLRHRMESLYAIRERYAREFNLPPNSVVANRLLYELVEGRMSPAELRPARGVPADRFASMLREMETG